MRIQLQWAFSKEDMAPRACALCEAEFIPEAVIIRVDPYAYEACGECLRALDGRKRQEPRAPWPTWEEYQEALRRHPEPMFPSAGAVEADEMAATKQYPESGYWPTYDRSILWEAAS